MLKRKKILMVCILIVMISTFSFITNAYEKDGHDDLMNNVLLSNHPYQAYLRVKDKLEIKQAIEALGNAAYLTIDQYNHSGQKALDMLIEYGVKGIPQNISEIDYTASPKTHREKTHRGWNFNYPDKQLWEIRKQILINTVDKIFDFDGNEKKRDAFCALVYYIHILGDHLDDESLYISNNNGRKIAVGGRSDKDDIIDEIINIIPILFDTQISTYKYQTLLTGLQSKNTKIKKLMQSEGQINTEEKFIEYKAYTQETVNILMYNVPGLLKDEEFFKDVFY